MTGCKENAIGIWVSEEMRVKRQAFEDRDQHLYLSPHKLRSHIQINKTVPMFPRVFEDMTGYARRERGAADQKGTSTRSEGLGNYRWIIV